MKKAVLICAAVIVLIFSSAHAQDPVVLFSEPDGSPGRVHPIGLSELNPHPLDVFWYTESYFFIAILDDGHIAYVNFMLSNMGLKKRQPALTITVITPGLERLTTEAEYDPDDFNYSQDCFRLKVGDNLLEGGPRNMRLKVSHGCLGMDLEFHGSFDGYKVGDGKAYFGENREIFYYIDYPAPRPTVEGTLTINGKAVPVKGWGYVDHCYYNADSTDFENVWHNFKFNSPEYSLILTSFTTPERFGCKPVCLAAFMDNDKVVAVTTEVIVTEKLNRLDPDGQKNYPNRLDMEFKFPGMRVSTGFDSSRVVEKMDVLEKLEKGAATRALKFVINTFVAEPYYYRAANDAVIEITAESGARRSVAGRAVSEVIFVK